VAALREAVRALQFVVNMVPFSKWGGGDQQKVQESLGVLERKYQQAMAKYEKK